MRLSLLIAAATLVGAGCAPGHTTPPRAREPPAAPFTPAPPIERAPDRPSAPMQVGIASWYGRAFAGKKTASGERFDPRQLTAAHRKLPFGTWVEVRRVDSGKTVRVRINDRGPNGRARHRIIDLSERAAKQLDLVHDGVTRVELRIVGGP